MRTVDDTSTTWLDCWAVWLATGLGIGLMVPAPGTIGGLWGVPLVWAIAQFPRWEAQLIALVVLELVAVAVCTRAARALGPAKDPQAVVLDEIAALPIVFLGAPLGGPAVWIAGFLLFRLFDITKLAPARQAERLPEGWGIMADDWVAGVQACAALHVLLWLDQALHLAWLTAAA